MINNLFRRRTYPPLTSRRAFWIMVLSFGIVYALWNIDFLSPIAYPFRLFVTFVHEAGHTSMALITGGRVLGFTVSADGSGLATTAGGNRALILMAGYLGAALFGAVLFYLVNTTHRSRTIAMILGGGIIIFTLLYARPDANGIPLALFVGLLSGIALFSTGQRDNPEISHFVLNILAIMTALNAVLDIWYLTRINRVTENLCEGRGPINDAAAFTCDVAPAIPPVIWAFLWAGIAVAMMLVSVYYSILRPMLRTAEITIQDRKIAPDSPALKSLKRDEDGEIDFSQF